jgi:hypothetical protein
VCACAAPARGALLPGLGGARVSAAVAQPVAVRVRKTPSGVGGRESISACSLGKEVTPTQACTRCRCVVVPHTLSTGAAPPAVDKCWQASRCYLCLAPARRSPRVMHDTSPAPANVFAPNLCQPHPRPWGLGPTPDGIDTARSTHVVQQCTHIGTGVPSRRSRVSQKACCWS